ncbi:hypothetical protein GCM10011494_15890 [Novosphingobium endophyticum]|uniref:PilZ domain-containing protein n=1 Tax=Novosphingobium endophyticum TaxID=1955250 RepID=A0A916TSS6_9SPHN|nr:PilZ domain-containing protein [Novosphingobium endophyticum]GGB98237.1 hypothetical protein GCM10011494_15890 [Novosphingobium endophyticum]
MLYERIAGRDGRHVSRSARAGVALVCDARQGTRPWKKVRLEDLSACGFRIAWFPAARPDMPLRLKIPGMQILSAQIVWQSENSVGCKFSAPLHIAVFEHIVRSSGPA